MGEGGLVFARPVDEVGPAAPDRLHAPGILLLEHEHVPVLTTVGGRLVHDRCRVEPVLRPRLDIVVHHDCHRQAVADGVRDGDAIECRVPGLRQLRRAWRRGGRGGRGRRGRRRRGRGGHRRLHRRRPRRGRWFGPSGCRRAGRLGRRAAARGDGKRKHRHQRRATDIESAAGGLDTRRSPSSVACRWQRSPHHRPPPRADPSRANAWYPMARTVPRSPGLGGPGRRAGQPRRSGTMVLLCGTHGAR